MVLLLPELLINAPAIPPAAAITAVAKAILCLVESGIASPSPHRCKRVYRGVPPERVAVAKVSDGECVIQVAELGSIDFATEADALHDQGAATASGLGRSIRVGWARW